jgi:hypothetical protein
MSEGLLRRLTFSIAVAMALPALLVQVAWAGEFANKLVAEEAGETRAVTLAFRETKDAAQPAVPSPTPEIGGDWGSCMDCCCRPRCGFYIYSEATFLAPFSDNEAKVLVSDVAVPTDMLFSDPVDELDDGLLIGPRIWLGYQCDHFGIGARYWGVGAADGNEAKTFDLEGNYRFCFCNWNLMASVGGRWAKVQTGGEAAVVRAYPDAVVDPLASALALSSSRFEGAGITYGLWGSRPICCDSSWNYFWSVRSSYLWGGSLSALAYTNGIVVDPALASATETDTAFARDDNADMFIGEVQVGLQWQQALQCCPAQAFFRVAFEWQTWAVVSGDVYAESFSRAVVDAASTTMAMGYAQAGNPDLNLLGFTIGAGLTY